MNAQAVLVVNAAAANQARSGRWRRLVPRGKGLVGLALVLVVVLGGLFAPVLSPRDPVSQNLAARLTPPLSVTQPGHLLGTDSLGRDLLSRILYGARLSLVIGLSTVLIAGTVGALLGLLAGYFGGWVDSIIMRLIDIQLSIPFLVLALAVASVVKPGIVNLVLILAFSGWVVYGRVVRGEVLSIRQREYIESARAIGASEWRILFRHILPNTAALLIIVSTLQVGSMILSEAGLSFLGLGVQPPEPAWGTMVADGRGLLATAWWVSTLPGLAILLTVLGINFFGDWLRDVLDPTVRIS